MYGNFPQYQQNPYLARLNTMQPQQAFSITRVTGKSGAEAFQMPPNSSILLLDETAPIVWLKSTDGAGYPTCTPYSISPYQAAPEPNFGDLNTRLKRLEDVIYGKQSDIAGTQSARPAVAPAEISAVPAADAK